MIYLSLLLLLFILAVFDSCVQKQYFAFPGIIDSNNVNVNLRGIRNKIPISFMFMFLWFIYATTIMGLRGNFSTDYDHYSDWFYRINNMSKSEFWDCFGLKNVFSTYMETGYVVINKLVGSICLNHVWLFVVCSIIICLPVFFLFAKCPKAWIAVLLWISIGPYLESFNTMRGAMAASILIFSLKYIEERKPIKYILIVLLATLFHSISILMLVAYFLPNIKPSKASILFIGVFAVVVSLCSEYLTIMFNSVFHIANDAEGALLLLHRNKSSGASLIVPATIELISLFVFWRAVKCNSIDISDKRIRLIYNGNLIWFMFKLLTLITGYSVRFAMLFFCYPCVFISFVLSKYNKSIIPQLLIILFAVAWYLVNTLVRYPEYYFAIR